MQKALEEQMEFNDKHQEWCSEFKGQTAWIIKIKNMTNQFYRAQAV